MKKWFLIGVLTFGLSAWVKAQPRYGNEWIRFEQPYAKITIAENGIYKVTFAQLQQAGVVIKDPTHLQLFHRGEEIALRVGQDFIEFYAEANDGAQDSLLYRPYGARLHPYYSLFSQQTAYYLTIGTEVGKRVTEWAVKNPSLVAEPYHLQQELTLFTEEFSFNNATGPVPFLQQSFYEAGEGRTGKWIRRDSTAVWSWQLTNWVKNQIQPTLEIMVNGRTEFFHQITASVGFGNTQRPFGQLDFFGFLPKKAATPLAETDVNVQGRGQFSLKATSKDAFEIYSLSYYKLVYPQSFDMGGAGQKVYYLRPNTANRSLVQIPNAPDNAQVWDITQRAVPRRLTGERQATTYSVVVTETNQPRTLLVTNVIKSPVAIFAAKFNPILFQNYTYLILTHPRLRESANAYATYRNSVAGGNHRVGVFEIQDIYEQFGYGERHPIAVRRWADWMTRTGNRPFLFLLGRAVSFPDLLRDNPDDLVPTWGYPASDALLTAGLGNENAETPTLPTGRLSVTRNEEALAYLQKIKEFENNAPNELWRKRILHLSGGKSDSEISDLRNVMTQLSTFPRQQWIGARTTALSKQSPVEVENVNISAQLNEGVGLITFFGHASPTVTDLNIGFASTAGNGLNNQYRYPFMYFNGCGVGNVFLRQNTLTTDWLFTPNRGAIGVLAHSFWSYSNTTQSHLDALYRTLFNDRTQIGMPIGKVQQEVNRRLSKQAQQDQFMLANLHQSILQGDPAVVLYPMSKPDYQVKATGIVVQSKNGISVLSKTDSVLVGVTVANVGLYDSLDRVILRVKIAYRNGRISETSATVKSIAYQDTVWVTLPRESDLQNIDVMADPDQRIPELDETNNVATLTIDWTKAAVAVGYPLAALPDKLPPSLSVFFDQKQILNNDFVAENAEILISLRDDNALSVKDTTSLEIFLKKCDKCSFERINFSNISLARRSDNELMATIPKVSLLPSQYTLLATGRDAQRNTATPLQVQFRVASAKVATKERVYPNPFEDFTKFEYVVEAPAAPLALTLTIFDVTGRLVAHSAIVPKVGRNEVLWAPAEQGLSGTYFYRTQILWPNNNSEMFQGSCILRR